PTGCWRRRAPAPRPSQPAACPDDPSLLPAVAPSVWGRSESGPGNAVVQSLRPAHRIATRTSAAAAAAEESLRYRQEIVMNFRRFAAASVAVVVACAAAPLAAQPGASAGPAVQVAQAAEPKRTPDVIFVPTPQKVVDEMLRIADVKKGD